MKNRLLPWVAAAFAAVILLPTVQTPAEPDPAQATAARAADASGTMRDTFTWSGRLAAGQTVEIKGINGAIDAEPAGGSTIELTATKKGKKSDPSTVEIEVVEHADGVTICAVYPSNGGRQNVCEPGDDGHLSSKKNDVQVHFDLRLPAGLDLVAKTVNGRIEAKDLGGSVKAETVNGSVQISTDGLARASTVNGSIKASIGSTDWSEPISFETVNGSLEVEMPASVNAEVRASSVNGRLKTDFPLDIPRSWHGANASGTLGAGGSQLELSTVNGSISIHRR